MIQVGIDDDQKGLHLVINGLRYDNDHSVSVSPVGLTGDDKGVGLIIHAYDIETSRLLQQQRFCEFPTEPWCLELPNNYESQLLGLG